MSRAARPGTASACSARARRRDIEVRRQPAIGIDLVRRKRQHDALDLGVGQALECREEESRIVGGALDVGVRRHDEQRSALHGGGRRGHRPCCRGEAGHAPR